MNDSINSRSRRRVSVDRWLSRLDHYAAWVSAILLLLYLISGFGMTRPVFIEQATGGLINWNRAYHIHYNLAYPLMAMFAIHTGMGLRRALIRTTRRKKIAGLVALGVVAVVFGYLILLSLG